MFAKLFGKKPASIERRKFFPENRLEALLMQAATDAGARPEFYKELFATDLFVLIASSARPHGQFVAQPGDTLSIKGINVEGKSLIPVFTSERRLREYIQKQENLARLNGQALFSMIASMKDGVVLNPGADYGKEFTHQEIVSLVDGSAFQTQPYSITKETQVLLGAPKEYPTKVVNALVSYFQGKSAVKKAYVAQIHTPDSGEPPHLIFAIQTDGDFRPIASELGIIFRDTLDGGVFADLLQLGQGTLDDYFEQQQPFFEQ